MGGWLRRIAVIGTTGSGKTTLAGQIAVRLGIRHIEMDSLHWEPNWVEASLPVFRARIQNALSGEAWVIDGNYSKVRDIVWRTADTIIWLDYPLTLILWRLLKRGLRRVIFRETLWGGNRETWRNLFLSRDSLFVWALKTYSKNKRRFPEEFVQPQHAHLQVIHFTRPQDAARWVDSLPCGR